MNKADDLYITWYCIVSFNAFYVFYEQHICAWATLKSTSHRSELELAYDNGFNVLRYSCFRV